MSRRRSAKRRHWPDNLQEASGYYSWRNPLTGEHLGIGRVEFAEASAQAVEANLHILGLLQKPRLVDRLTGRHERTVDAFWALYEKKLKAKRAAEDLGVGSLKAARSCARAMLRKWGGRLLASITTLDVSAFLAAWKDAGQLRMAQVVRTFLLDFFRSAEAEGWLERGTNPATVTDTIRAAVKRARLTLETFQVIYDAAAALDPWVQNSMALALVSLQRREEIAVGEFAQRADSRVYVAERRLCVIQKKAKPHEPPARLRIPLELTLDALGWSLDACIRRCRDDVVSRWLIHHTKPRTKSRPGDPVWLDTISKGFARARDRSGLEWPDQEPPTFHEIRSLGIRLYKEQGNVDPQALAGHRDPASTAIYLDPRGVAWTDIKVA